MQSLQMKFLPSTNAAAHPMIKDLRNRMKRSVSFIQMVTLLTVLFGATSSASAANETITAGSFIINMGVVPQTVANGLKPYGLIYELINNHNVPIKWAINPNKSTGGVDFTYNGTDYKGGPFIVPAEYRNAAVNATIANWQVQGVVGITTTAAFTAPDRADAHHLPALDAGRCQWCHCRRLPGERRHSGKPIPVQGACAAQFLR